METKKSKFIILLICLLIFLAGIFIGYSLKSNDYHKTIQYGDYVTFSLENSHSTISLDLKNKKYFYSDNGTKSTEGNLKELDNHIYKFDTGHLKNGYIILTTVTDSQTVYINLNNESVTVCQYVNDQLTLIGG